jgi:hypothetical protein
MDIITRMLFSPEPTYPGAGAASRDGGEPLSDQALGYAGPAAETPTRSVTPLPATKPSAAAPRSPEKRQAAIDRAVKESAFVLNEAQISSIKDRLALTPDQQRYWPAVAAALRGITRQRAPDGAPKIASAANPRGTFVDPNGADVQRLKAAAIPLIMTMREDQKREVRALAHLMGLESVASQF